MRGLSCLVLMLFMVPVLPGATAAAPCSSMDEASLGACRQEAVDLAMTWLADQPLTLWTLEAVASTGTDPYAWPPGAPAHGALAPPDPQGPLGEGTVRLLHGLVALGPDPTAYPGPDGPVDLGAIARSWHGRIVATGVGGLLSWHLWTLHALGVPADDPDVRVATLALSNLQVGGAFPCSPGYFETSCTGWAVVALAAYDALSEDAREAATDSLAASRLDAGYACRPGGGMNLQCTVWAMQAMRSLGQPPRPADWQAVLSLQADDGRFFCNPPAGACAPGWSTPEAVVALAGGHPLPVHLPFTVAGPTPTDDGNRFRVEGAAEAAWYVAGEVHEGTSATFDLAPGTYDLHVRGRDGDAQGWVRVPLVIAGGSEPSPGPGGFLVLLLVALAAVSRRIR